MKSLVEFKKDIQNCDVINIIQISSEYLDSDVIERLDGMERYMDTSHVLNDKIYSVDDLKKEILNDEDDDTNETTKGKIETLYYALFNFDYFMIINMD